MVTEDHLLHDVLLQFQLSTWHLLGSVLPAHMIEHIVWWLVYFAMLFYQFVGSSSRHWVWVLFVWLGHKFALYYATIWLNCWLGTEFCDMIFKFLFVLVITRFLWLWIIRVQIYNFCKSSRFFIDNVTRLNTFSILFFFNNILIWSL